MTVFYTWPFPALGASSTRTMPARLSDVVNVKDWGALGNNSADDSAAIQAAIDFCISRGGGKVFFPSGVYLGTGTTYAVGTNTLGLAGNGVELIGSGYNNTIITGAMSKGGRTYDLLIRMEGLLISGGVVVTGTGVTIRNVFASIDASAAVNCTLYDCHCDGGGNQLASSATPFATNIAIGFALGQACTAINCRCVGSVDIGYALSGAGVSVLGCSCENNMTAMRIGWSSAGGGTEVAATGVYVSGFQTERVLTAIDVYNAEGFVITNVSLYTGEGPPIDAPITTAVWSGGVVTVTSTANHNLTAGTHILQFPSLSNTAFVEPAVAATGNYMVVATRHATDPQKFTYALTSNPGSWGSGTWTWPGQYGMRFRKAAEGVIKGFNILYQASIASFDMAYGGGAFVQRNNQVISVSTSASGGSISNNWGFLIPIAANLAGWQYQNLGIGSNNLTPLLGGSAPHTSPVVFLNFANLPGGTSNQDGPFETQEFDIADGQKSGGGAAAWNDIVSGGSSGHYRIRYDGTNWRRIG